MMQQSSLEAYQMIKPKLPQCRKVVYDVILDYAPISNKEIAERLDWPINKVTPRVKELRDMGLVHKVFKNEDPESHVNVNFWGCH